MSPKRNPALHTPWTEDERRKADGLYGYAIKVGVNRRRAEGDPFTEADRSIVHDALMEAVKGHDPELNPSLKSHVASLIHLRLSKEPPLVRKVRLEYVGTGCWLDLWHPIEKTAPRGDDDFESLLKHLSTDREREFMRRIYRDGDTQSDAGKSYGISRSHSSFVHANAIATLRLALKDKAA